MDLLTAFKDHIKKEQLFHPAQTLVLAISGGMDSVVLFELLRQAGYSFIAAHVNFGLRGDESLRDEHFVNELCNNNNIPFQVIHPATEKFSRDTGMSIQEAARKIRYDWFLQLSKEHQDAPVLTAHHADDNVETMLLFLLRGTGIHGLTGMPPRNGNIRRPLLTFTRSQLHEFAEKNNLHWVEDSSNLTIKYTRNAIRNVLLPRIRELFPSAQQNLYENLSRFRDAAKLYDQAIAVHKKKLLEPKEGGYRISILKLLKAEPLETILYECIKSFGFNSAQVNDILQLTAASNGKFVQSSTHRIIRDRNWLLISPLEAEENFVHVIEQHDPQVNFSEGVMHFSIHNNDHQRIDPSSMIAQLDLSRIKFPLLLRKWKPGDYFYPLGMKKKKKIARFMIDQKLSLLQKQHTWILESDRKIIWVVGMRIDDRVKITPSSQQLLRIAFQKHS